MYAHIDIVKKLEPIAEKFVLDNDRMLYKPFFEETERFCVQNSVLLGGRIGIDLLVGKELTRNSFLWDLYCEDTFVMAKRLANTLAKVHSPHISARTVALQTNIRSKEFTLSVNARVLFKIYSVDRYRGVSLVSLMGPVTRISYFTKTEIKCISEEIQLIDIYRTLYSPAKVALWAEELENEKSIYALSENSLREKATKILGGRDFRSKEIQSLLLNKIVAKSKNVLIGDHALMALGIENSPTRIQFISEDAIESIRDAVEKTLSPRVKITYIRYPLNIPSDFQILKHTLYAVDGKSQIPIVDVFNSSQFEMIPYTLVDNVRVGNPWVLLRFLFIDLWVLKLILNLGTDNPGFIKEKIHVIVEHANSIRTRAMAALQDTFQLTNYAGVYISETVAKKKLIKEIGERFATYYPAKMPESEITGAAIVSYDHIKSAPIDITADVATKRKIINCADGDIIRALRNYNRIHSGYSDWGIKPAQTFDQRNYSQFASFVPPRIINYVDIGCGDCLNIIAAKKISIAATALPRVESDSIDLTTIFHSIHRVQGDIAAWLKNIVRFTKIGGLIFIIDHDVRDRTQAGNVDFEHLLHVLPQWDGSLEDLMANFDKQQPMTYHSAEEINSIMTDCGCECVWTDSFTQSYSYIYGAVYNKTKN